MRSVGCGLGHDVRQKFQVLHPAHCARHISVLDIAARLPLALDNVVALLDEVLEEHFRCDGYDEGGVVGAVTDVVVGGDDLLHSGHYNGVSRGSRQGGWWSVRGSDTVPVISAEGVIGVLLYGILAWRARW